MNSESRAIFIPIGHNSTQTSEVRNLSTQASESPGLQTPLIDIYESGEGLILEADLPGVSVSDLEIELAENVLSFRGLSHFSAPKDSSLLHEEFRILGYQRSFILSDEVDRSRISAELKNGVLRLVLPKAERPKPRKIEIITAK